MDDYRELMRGTASTERRNYAKFDAMQWYKREFIGEDLQQGKLDFDASKSGGMGMANASDYIWSLNTSLDWGPPR